MLVLSRRKNEKIAIAGGFANGGVDICLVEIRGDSVRLGIDAPGNVAVHRAEVQDAIDRQAARSTPLTPSPADHPPSA